MLLVVGLTGLNARAQTSAEPRRVTEDSVPYPEGGQGNAEVVLELDISEEGTVTAAKLRRGRNPFARAARTAVLGWRFSPALRNGNKVPARVLTKITFVDPMPVIPALDALASVGDTLPEAPAPEPEAGDELDQVVILAERRNEIGGTLVPREEVRQIPGAFADPFRVAEVLPGIAPIVSGVPYFFVRGAPPGNVGYFIDGIRVPLLFHVGPGPSIIAPGLIERVDVVPSGYSARFGRVAGGVMSGETVASSGAMRGEFQARAFDASGLLEVPIAAQTSSVLFAGRYSYAQPLLDQVAPEYELGYWDYQTRANYQASPNDLFTLFAFGAADRLKNRSLDRVLFDTAFHRLDLRWDHTTSSSSSRVALTGAMDKASNAEEDDVAYASGIQTRGLRLRFSTDQRVSRDVMIRMGGDAGLDRIEKERLLVGEDFQAFPVRTDLSGSLFFDTVLTAPGVEVVPGVRADAARWRGQRETFIEPRLASRVRIFRYLAWVSQLGLSHQLPTQNVRVPGQAAEPLESSIQASWQAAEGLEFGSSSVLTGRITAFHTWNDATDPDLLGRSYGIEAFLRRSFTEGVGGILSYTLSRTVTTDERETLPSEFDRTHVLSLVLGADLGAGFRLGLRGYYATGQNYAVACPTPDCGPANEVLDRPFIVRGRLPDFYRADVRFEKRWELGTTGWFALTFEWFNATFSKETTTVRWAPAGGLEYPGREPLTVPSLGIEGGF